MVYDLNEKLSFHLVHVEIFGSLECKKTINDQFKYGYIFLIRSWGRVMMKNPVKQLK